MHIEVLTKKGHRRNIKKYSTFFYSLLFEMNQTRFEKWGTGI
jgi:hypothetical protein